MPSLYPDLTAVYVSSELRDTQNNLIAELVVEAVTEQPGTYTLSYSGDTSDWPLGLIRLDVKLTEANGTLSHTETVTVAIVDRVTQ